MERVVENPGETRHTQKYQQFQFQKNKILGPAILHQDTMNRDRREDGISEVVGFVIILAVVVASLSLYLTYAVPVQGREEEITVMDGVRAWFVDYKTGVDQLWLNSPAVSKRTTPYVPDELTLPNDRMALFGITTGQVTLRRVLDPGTSGETGFIRRYMPLLSPIPASASVSVRTEGNLTVTGWRNASEPPVLNQTFPGTALVYTSHNNYWLQQEYSYQLGAVFLRQWDIQGIERERMTVVASPPLSIYPPEGETGYQTKADLVVVNVKGLQKGFGAKSPIRTETSLSSDPWVLEPDDNKPWSEYSHITLTFTGSSHESATAWYNIFNGAATRNGINLQYFIATPPSEPAGTVTTIDIRGYAYRDPEDNAVLDVQFEALVADFEVQMENIPTRIQ